MLLKYSIIWLGLLGLARRNQAEKQSGSVQVEAATARGWQEARKRIAAVNSAMRNYENFHL